MKALLVIDIQNDYFPGGKFPLDGGDACAAPTKALSALALSGLKARFLVE